jgi:hypothetical protein
MQSIVEKFRKYRDENYRSHDEIIELWTKTLSKHNLSSLGDEKWLILEQVFKSALHCSQHTLAFECLEQFIMNHLKNMIQPMKSIQYY